jgi:hypothetical protein
LNRLVAQLSTEGTQKRLGQIKTETCRFRARLKRMKEMLRMGNTAASVCDLNENPVTLTWLKGIAIARHYLGPPPTKLKP